MYLDHQRALIALDKALDDLAATTSQPGPTRINATDLQISRPPMRKSSLQSFQPNADANQDHQPRYQRSQPWLSPLQRLDQNARDDGDCEPSGSGALDPTLALPRALPRSALFSDDSVLPQRDSFHSGIGLQESLQPGDRMIDISKNCRACRQTSEQSPLGSKHGEHYYRPRIDDNRLVQYRKVYDDGFEDILAQKQSATREPGSPASTIKVKKTARLGRFSFLKGRQSLPVPPKNTQEGAAVQDPQSRSQSMTNQVRKGFEAGEDTRQANSSQPGEVSARRASKAKQLFLDVFKLSSKPNAYVESPKTGSPLKQHTEISEEPVAVARLSRELPARPVTPPLDPVEMVHDHTEPQQQDLSDSGEPDQDSHSADDDSYAKQTSLAPPPASFVIRHSSSYNDIYSSKRGSLANAKTLGDYSTVGPTSVLPENLNEIRNLTVALGNPGRRGSHSSQRRFVDLAPEQKADLEDVGHRHQNTFGIAVAVV
ncbi:hypothetical protein BGZ75_009591 [Mortierella antarctica]|nr:hypothetical protein BGZ75_009591 [Mortierella antarctica]